MSISILMVDDHPVFRFGLRALIEAEADLRIVGEAASGSEALELAASQPIDLVLMDIKLPDMNGLEVTRRLRALQPTVHVLIISMLDDSTVFQALKAGACGYILKGSSGEETLRAMRAVAGGEAIFSPTIAQRLMHYFSAPQPQFTFPELTEREREVLVLLAQGLTNSAIAERLHLSAKTVRNRVSDIFSKLHVSDRAQAIIKARDAGMG
jgi:DNA-binding NarL/FixJ family response regulator